MAFNLRGFIKGILIKNDADQSKKLTLSIDNAATTGKSLDLKAKHTDDRVLEFPDASGILVEKDATQTLTNKTIDGDNNTVQDLALSTLKTDVSNANKFLNRDGSGVVTTAKTIPSSEVVGTSDTQILSNKTIDGDDNTVQDLPLTSLKTVLGDANKVLVRDASGIVTSSSTIPSTAVPTGISAENIANGTVDNTEFQYLNGVTSGIQTQLGNKINTSEKGAALGVASLDAGGKIPVGQVPSIALTDVYVVADIAARDLLTVEEGDVAKVLDDGDGNVVNFIYDGTSWQSLASDDVVNAHAATTTGIHGVSGNLVGTSDIQTLSNKTIDGDDNTVQDLPLTSLKTVLGDASKFLQRDASGIVVSDKAVPTGTVVGTTDTQVLTNKDIDGGTASNSNRITIPRDTYANLVALTRKEGTIVYATDTDTFYADNGTSLIPVGSGSGIGGINYIAAFNAEDSTQGITGWTDIAGSGAGSWVLSSQNTTVLRGSKSFKITKTGDCTGKMSEYKYTIDAQDKNKSNYWSMDVYTDGSYVVDDVAFDVQSNTLADWTGTTTTITVRGSVVNGRATFNIPTNNDLYYKIRIKANNSNTNNYNFYFDTVVVGPDKLIDGPIVTYLGQYNIEPINGGTATYTLSYQDIYRRGELAKIDFRFTINAAGNGSSVVYLPLPSGMTWDSSKNAHIGTLYTNAGTLSTSNLVCYPTASGIILVQNETAVRGSDLEAGSGFYGSVEIPILEWANQSAVLSTTEMMNETEIFQAYPSANTTLTTGGTYYTVLFDNTITSAKFASLNNTTGIITLLEKGRYLIIAKCRYNNVPAGEYTVTRLLKNSVTNLSVDYGNSSAGGNEITGSVSTIANFKANETIELQAQVAASSGIVINSSQIYTSIEIVKLPDFSVYGVYGNYEVLSSVSANYSLSSVGASGSIIYLPMTGNSITLPIGTFLLLPSIYFELADTSTVTDLISYLYSSNGLGNTTAPTLLTSTPTLEVIHSGSSTRYKPQVGATSLDDSGLAMAPAVVNVLSPTTVYNVPRVSWSAAGTSYLTTYLTAIRLR